MQPPIYPAHVKPYITQQIFPCDCESECEMLQAGELRRDRCGLFTFDGTLVQEPLHVLVCGNNRPETTKSGSTRSFLEQLRESKAEATSLLCFH